MTHAPRVPFADEFPVQQVESAALFPRELCDAAVGCVAPETARQQQLLLEEHPTLSIQGHPGALELLRSLPRRGLGIVGTRRAEPRALSLIESVIHDLRDTPAVIVSGFALGVDQRAHHAALRSGLRTVAFLGTPLDRDYPRGSLGLRRQILAQGGVLISETPLGGRVFPKHFLDRNRWIAALSEAVWLVQAPQSSGALSTAAHARAFERDLYITPAFPGDPAFAGNLTELERPYIRGHVLTGARALASTWLSLPSEWVTQSGRATQAANPQEALAARASDSATATEEARAVLIREVGLRTRLDGGVALDQLLEFACTHRIEFADFYEVLSTEVQTGSFRDERGWITQAPGPLRASPGV